MYNVSLLMDGLSLNIFDDITVYYMVISHMVWLISNHVTLRYYFFTKYTKLFDTIGFSIQSSTSRILNISINYKCTMHGTIVSYIV